MEKKKALGRGLSALIPGASSVAPIPIRREFFECDIEDVHPSDENPRQVFDGERLKELADSIRAQGVAQPLLVRTRQGGGYTLIAGERRWRAAQLAGLHTVPVVVKEVSPQQAFELAIVENLQREDLNPIEEAEAFDRLIAEYHYTQEQMAERVGKDRTTVANSLRLLKLPPATRTRVAAGELSMGHARALLGLEQAAAIDRAAARVMQKQLSVRQTEELVRRERAPQKPKAKPAPSASVRDLEQKLERSLGTRVRLAQKSNQSGTIEIEYASLDQLDGLLERLLTR
jgi:ParB family transcriptional regulator, chromosome partitioning protein